MANNSYLSPGLVLQEIDKSEILPGPVEEGPCAIGLCKRGPAFVPVFLNGWSQYIQTFGDRYEYHYPAFAAYYHFKNKSTFTTVRLLGVDPETTGGTEPGQTAGFQSYTAEPVKSYALIASGTTEAYVHSIMHTTGSITTGSNLAYNNFDITVQGTAYNISLIKTDKNYIDKVLNTDPSLFTPSASANYKGHYLWDIYDFGEYYANNVTSWFVATASVTSGVSYAMPFTTPETPWITSQDYGSGTTLFYDLFKFNALGDGEYDQENYKVSVLNIKKSPNEDTTKYGTFSVMVRDFADTDMNPVIYEQYNDLSLDPASRNYILRRIGDRRRYFDFTTKTSREEGTYENKSKIIRVTLSPELKKSAVPKDALPFGYRVDIGQSYPKLAGASFVYSSSIGTAQTTAEVKDIPVQKDMKWKGEYKSNLYWGPICYYTSASSNTWKVYDYTDYVRDRIRETPEGATLAYDKDFSLNYLSCSEGTLTSALSTEDDTTLSAISYAYNSGNIAFDYIQGSTVGKFSVLFYGGWDGWNPHYKNNLDNFYMNAFTSDYFVTANWKKNCGVTAFRRAIDSLADRNKIKMTDLYLPNIYHPAVVNYAEEIMSQRTDVFVINDISGSSINLTDSDPNGTPTDATDWLTTWNPDSNYVAVYYGALLAYNDFMDQMTWLPPSIGASYAYAFNDANFGPWNSPAGMTRGLLDGTFLKIHYITENTQRNPELDNLYVARINPITMINDKNVIWGAKTLQVKNSALNRIPVKRMVLYLKRQVAKISYNFIFEKNLDVTWAKWVTAVDPILQFVKSNLGLERYEVKMDASLNTPDKIANHEMNGVIVLVAAEEAELISISFTVQRNSIVFTS